MVIIYLWSMVKVQPHERANFELSPISFSWVSRLEHQKTYMKHVEERNEKLLEQYLLLSVYIPCHSIRFERRRDL